MYLSLLVLAAALAPQPQTSLSSAQLEALEAACSGWSGEMAYQRAHGSGACMTYLGAAPGERSAFESAPDYSQQQGED